MPRHAGSSTAVLIPPPISRLSASNVAKDFLPARNWLGSVKRSGRLKRRASRGRSMKAGPPQSTLLKSNRRRLVGAHAAAALRLLILTGAQPREVLNLRWEWVDLERGLLLLPDSKTGRKSIVLNAPAIAVLADFFPVSVPTSYPPKIPISLVPISTGHGVQYRSAPISTVFEFTISSYPCQYRRGRRPWTADNRQIAWPHAGRNHCPIRASRRGSSPLGF